MLSTAFTRPGRRASWSRSRKKLTIRGEKPAATMSGSTAVTLSLLERGAFGADAMVRSFASRPWSFSSISRSKTCLLIVHAIMLFPVGPAKRRSMDSAGMSSLMARVKSD